ncbi:RhoGAP-domain-containing protein [Hortaea werneckii]|nr:RhoGAP-domain-containing protein [Hortaea werneckii]
MASGGPSTAQAGGGGPRPAPPAQNERVEQKRDLASWWKNFKRGDKKAQETQAPSGIFGVPLQQSIRYANVAISLYNDEGQSYIYGYVPIVVAKCGVYLKEKATDVEGIFRLAGSEKRIKELKVAFDSPDRYGKGLDWTGYTVHDAANILRRYFNQLPEPIIPLEFYQRFRQPLRNHQAQAVGAIEAQGPSVGDFNHDAAIKAYQGLITELPPLNRQLLLYILDLLAVFASKSDLNKMTTANLAAIFQPGILSHPQHDMAPQEYRLSQDVLIFLIENQDSFLIGMPGTGADPETVREVQSGTPVKQPTTPTTPTRSKTVVGRSSSNASAGADSVRKWGNLRRNVSVSSKNSKRSEGGPTPITSSIGSPATPTSSVHRSNTVPSRRAGSAAYSHRFSREKTSDPPTPSPSAVSAAEQVAPKQESVQAAPTATSTAPSYPQAPEVISASSSEATTPMAMAGVTSSSATQGDYVTPKKDTTPLLAPSIASSEPRTERSPSTNASSGHGFLNIFKQSPTSDNEGGRKPNKLQKKRIPGSALSSAQSSAQSLHEDEHPARESVQNRSSGISGRASNSASEEVAGDMAEERTIYSTAQTTPVQATPQRTYTDATLRPTTSPTQSFHSTDMSDADMVGDDLPKEAVEQPEREKKRHRWRFSRSQNRLDQPQTPGEKNTNPLGTMSPRDQATSRSTIGSGTGSQPSQPRRSFQEPAPLPHAGTDPVPGSGTQPHQGIVSSGSEAVFSDSEREKKGPMSWIRGKIQERRDREAERRAKTPERTRDRSESKQDVLSPAESMPTRGKSMEQQRPETAIPKASGPGQTQPTQTAQPTSVPAAAPPASAGQAAADQTSAPKEAPSEEAVAHPEDSGVTAEETQQPGERNGGNTQAPQELTEEK